MKQGASVLFFGAAVSAAIILSSVNFSLVPAVSAAEADIQFPIQELGNCADKNECKIYCDESSHKDVCLAFAEKNGLMSQQEIEKARSLPPVGPGGCRGESECRTYCQSGENADECLVFAENYNMLPAQELKHAKEFLTQSGPGGCRGQECKTYCDNIQHQGECVDFAIENGLIAAGDAKFAKMVAASGGPGGCKSKEECESFCNSGENSEVCLNFAEVNGMISKEEAAYARKLGFSSGPGGCKGNDCRSYCDDASHAGECIDYGVQNGLILPAEAEMAKKLLNKAGPGGCKGQECKIYCDNPDNGEACLAFAEQNNLIPAEEIAQAKKFMQLGKQNGPGGCKGRECKTFCDDPANKDVCFSFAKDNGLIPAEDLKKIEVGQKLQQTLKEKSGPGGCKTEEDCRAYCADSNHSSECVAFVSATGAISSDEAIKMLDEFQKMKGSIPGGSSEGMQFGPPPGLGMPGAFGGRPGGADMGAPANMQKQLEQFKQMEARFREGKMPQVPQGMMPHGGEFGPPKGFDGSGGAPSPEEIQKMIQQNISQYPNGMMPESGYPSGAISPDGMIPQMSPSGSYPMPPANIYPPQGFEGSGGAPTPEEIQKMIQQSLPQGYAPSGGYPNSYPSGGVPSADMMPQIPTSEVYPVMPVTQ